MSRVVAALLFAGSLAGCRDTGPTGPTGPTYTLDELRAAVTPEVAANLDADGSFVFPHAPPPPGEISLARARALALAYWKTHGAVRRRILEHYRGGPISMDLELCAYDGVRAQSAYDPMGPGVNVELRRSLGDQWIVGLCRHGEQQVAVAVSVEAVDVIITAEGTMRNLNGGDIASYGVPAGTTMPARPEFAVVGTARAGGTRVAALPMLRRYPRGLSVFNNYWVLPLEWAIEVRGRESGLLRTVSTLAYGGLTKGLDIMDANLDAPSGPREESYPLRISDVEVLDIVVVRRADVPARYEHVFRDSP